jgi:hypothetical protein
MKNLLRRLLLGAAVVFAGVCNTASSQSPVVIQQAYNETYHVVQVTVAENSYCSATAIGPFALLTATHCELGTDEIALQGKGGKPDVDLKIDGRIRDGYDHTILLISPTYLAGYKFTTFAAVDLLHKFDFGQDVFFIGNPRGFSELFRKGYVAGSATYTSALGENVPEILIDINVGHGDSGAAIFDSNGAVIGVVAGIEVHGTADEGSQYKMPYALALNFTDGQIKEAVAYGTTK